MKTDLQPVKGGDSLVMLEIRTRRGEPIEKALRRLKKKLDKEGTLKELRSRRHYEKPSERNRRRRRRSG